MLRGLKDNFEFEGYKVLTATDGDAGLKAALGGQLGARSQLPIPDQREQAVGDLLGERAPRDDREPTLRRPSPIDAARGGRARISFHQDVRSLKICLASS